jgi:hypothetical protein
MALALALHRMHVPMLPFLTQYEKLRIATKVATCRGH